MACKKIKQEWSVVLDTYIEEFICDSDDDFAHLPSAAPGSSALSISSGSVTVVNAQGNWVAFGG